MIQKHPYFTPWFKTHCSEYDLVLFDIDGTLIHGSHPIHGIPELLQSLRHQNIPFLLLTNDANHSREEKQAILARRGIHVTFDEIISAGQPLSAYVKRHHLDQQLAYVLGELGSPCYAESAGLRVTRNPKEAKNCDLIIVGESNYDWETHITLAINILRKHPDRPFLVPNPDGFWPGAPGSIGIGAGGVARFIVQILKELHCNVEPVYFGKPSTWVYQFALQFAQERFQRIFTPERTLMVGDNIASDILGANQFGIPSALMLTGVTSESQLKSLPYTHLPQFVFEAIISKEQTS